MFELDGRVAPRQRFYLAAFFLAAHLAFIIADSFFLIAGLIGLRVEAFF